MSVTLTGDKQLRANLQHLGKKSAPRIAKRVVLVGAKVVADAIRKAAPGRVKREVGYRLDSRDGERARAIVGLGVARQKRIGNIGHLVTLGTTERFRKRIGGKFGYITKPTKQQLSTGRVLPNPFVQQAITKSRSAANAAMRRTAARAIEQALTSMKG